MSACHPCSVSRQIGADNCYPFLLPTFADRSILNLLTVHRIWRKRVGVEPTPESAKDTGYGFEDHEDHRAPCASASSIEEPLGALKASPFSNVLGNERGGLVSSNEGSNEIVERGTGTNFVVGMIRGAADFSVRDQLARDSLAQHEKL